MNLELLRQYGVDTQKGIARCMGDASFYEQVLRMFLQDNSFDRARAAFERGEQRTLFSCAHELKGVCGNADLTELFAVVCPLVELLRTGERTPEEIAPQFERVESAYRHVREGLLLALGE